MTNHEIRSLLNEYMTATVAQDFDQIAAFLDEDFTLWMVPSVADHGLPNPLSGRQRYLDFVRELNRRPSMWKPRTFTIDEIFFGDAAAAIRVRLIGDFASGFEYDCEYVFTFRFRDGKVLEKREFVDTAYIASLNRMAIEHGRN
jgi:ketosteroid isomerase-like protein